MRLRRRRYGHAQLLLALALLLFVNPFLEGLYGRYVVDALLWLTFAAAIFTCSERRWHLAAGVSLMVLVFGLGVYRDYADVGSYDAVYASLAVAFSLFLTYLVLRDVLGAGPVDANRIFGALSAYLFLAITWAFAYSLLEWWAPGSFTGLHDTQSTGRSGYYRFVGFSLVTITTLGYGNVTPATTRADALCTSEAVIGQIYLTVLVARLVALSIRPETTEDVEEGES